MIEPTTGISTANIIDLETNSTTCEPILSENKTTNLIETTTIKRIENMVELTTQNTTIPNLEATSSSNIESINIEFDNNNTTNHHVLVNDSTPEPDTQIDQPMNQTESIMTTNTSLTATLPTPARIEILANHSPILYYSPAKLTDLPVIILSSTLFVLIMILLVVGIWQFRRARVWSEKDQEIRKVQKNRAPNNRENENTEAKSMLGAPNVAETNL